MFRIVALAALLPLFLSSAAHAQVLEHRRVVRQSSFFEGHHPAVQGDTVSLNGSFLLARWNMTMADFLAFTEEDVTTWLHDHLQPGGHLEYLGEAFARADRPLVYIFMDVEHALHPKNLWQYWDPEYYPDPPFTKQEIADAYAMRLRVLREVIESEYPNQKIKTGLFGTLHPSPSGYPGDEKFLKRRDCLIELASLGMLDTTDYLVPVIYARFPSTHVRHKEAARYTMQALDGSSMIRRSDGSSLPMMPLLSLRIYNGGQPDGLATVSWLQDCIDAIRDSGHWIEAIGFWVARQESAECTLAYFDRLFSPRDWNYDCFWNKQDDTMVSAAIAAQDPMADFNGDRVINDADWHHYKAIALTSPRTVACGASMECPCPYDFFDFLDFQQLFVLGDPAADLNNDGAIDFFDFLTLQQWALNPCP